MSIELATAIEEVARRRGDWHGALGALRETSYNGGVEVLARRATKSTVAAALLDAGTRAGLNADLVMATVNTAFFRASGGHEST